MCLEKIEGEKNLAEYVAIAEAEKEMIWMTYYLEELGRK